MKFMKCLCIVLLSLFLNTDVLFAAEKMQIAVLDLQPKGVSKIVAGAVSDIIRSEMVKTGLYIIVERAQMNEILEEQGFQMTGCTDQACAVKIGKLMSAQKMLVGEINKVGTGLMITIRIVDVAKGTSEYSASEKSPSEDEIDKAAVNITKSLSVSIVEGNREFFIETKNPTGYYARGFIPGWGQFYADHKTKGYAYAGTFATSAVFTIWSWFNYSSAADDYKNVPRNSAQSEFDEKYDAKKNAAKLFIGAISFTGVVYLTNWVDILFLSKPKSWIKTAYNENENFYVINAGNVFNDGRPESVMQFSYGMRF